MSERSWKRRIDKAKRINAERDSLDRVAGFATPAASGLEGYLATALAAITAGGNLRDWDSVAEGAVMLEDVLKGVIDGY